jgi:hypothetical protein
VHDAALASQQLLVFAQSMCSVSATGMPMAKGKVPMRLLLILILFARYKDVVLVLMRRSCGGLGDIL